MKKITIMLLAVLIFCVPCMTAFAETSEQRETTIAATVPSTHTITFISSSGRIENNGSTVSGHGEYDRRSEQTFHIIPDDGKEIDRVLYGGEDVTAQVKDGYFTTPPLTTDMTLEVIYKDAASPVEPVSEPTSEPTSEPDNSKPDTPKPDQSSSPDTSTPQNSENTDTVKTGDTTTAIVFVIAAVTTVSAAFIIILAKRRNKTV